jgi:hypothetical protein
MNSTRTPSIVLVLALVLAGCQSGGGGSTPPPGGSTGAGAAGLPGPAGAAGASGAGGGQLMAGAAAVDVTPPPGAPLAGFGGAPRRVMDATTVPLQILALFGPCGDPNAQTPTTFFAPSKGMLDPIMARAVVLSNGQTKIAILKLDVIGLPRAVHDDFAPIAASLGIPLENFIMCATHTHSGPGAMARQKLWELLAVDCFNNNLYQNFRAGVERALREADAALRPAEIGIGTTYETTASENRRGRPGIYDPEMGVIKITEAGSGAPIASVINFAVHGTCYGASNFYFSADCMGATERFIEGHLGGGVAIFVNGAEGDVRPTQDAGPEGAILGQRYVDAWQTLATKPWVVLQGAFEDVQLPAPMFNSGCIPVPGGTQTMCDIIPGFTVNIPLDPTWLSTVAPFKAVRIDKTVLATIPGEPITEIGWDIKARAAAKGFDRGFVVGLANDHISYITTEAEYIRGQYEGMCTMYGVYTGKTIVDAADRVMERVKP